MADQIITEEWRPVVGWEGFYEVSSFGNIRRTGNAELCGTWRDRYIAVSLRAPGRYTMKRIHALVLEAFIGPQPKGMEAAHFDGDAHNNRATNLRWDTRKANHRDQYRHGTRIRGSTHPMVKLTEDQVREILAAPKKRGVRTALARRFGVSLTTVSYICKRKTWTHIV